jgi:hypothetical protein
MLLKEMEKYTGFDIVMLRTCLYKQAGLFCFTVYAGFTAASYNEKLGLQRKSDLHTFTVFAPTEFGEVTSVQFLFSHCLNRHLSSRNIDLFLHSYSKNLAWIVWEFHFIGKYLQIPLTVVSN